MHVGDLWVCGWDVRIAEEVAPGCTGDVGRGLLMQSHARVLDFNPSQR